jgi:hypothetical protein
MALVTLPERMHLVQTFALLTVPLSLTLTVWIFAFHFLLVCLFEWDTLLPETWPLPQTEHLLDIMRTSFKGKIRLWPCPKPKPAACVRRGTAPPFKFGNPHYNTMGQALQVF